MSLAKIVVTGKITTNPEKRFTQSNLPITSFSMDINPQDETIVRVIAIGPLADRIADAISLGDSVIVDGRPQIETVKTTSGKEKRIVEINASAVEKIAVVADNVKQNKPSKSNDKEEIVQFATQEATEDLIDEDEIPF